jgi:AmiR/NasT family two-component response regulator
MEHHRMSADEARRLLMRMARDSGAPLQLVAEHVAELAATRPRE